MDYDNLSAAMVGQMTAYTDRTITDINDLDSDVAETRMCGYAVDTGELQELIIDCSATE